MKTTRLLLLLALLFANGCGSATTREPAFLYLPHPETTSLHWRTLEEHCNHCPITDRPTESQDTLLAEDALKALLTLHLSGSETPICSDAGIRSSSGVVLVTNHPSICGESCESTDIEMTSSVEAAMKLGKPNTWRVLELEFQGSVNILGENGVVVTCGTGHSGVIYTIHTLIAIRTPRGEIQFVTWFASA